MTKQFYFQITNGEDDYSWKSLYYQTKEKALRVRNIFKDEGYEVGEIMEERV